MNTQWKVFAKLTVIVPTSGLFFKQKSFSPHSSLAKYSSLVAHVDFPSTLFPKWQKHLPHKLHSQPHLPMETTTEPVLAKHEELFESKILVYVQPLISRLCPLHVHKHGFIVHNRFITMNCWSAVHYDISLQQSLARMISQRDIAKIVPISRWFIVLGFRYTETFWNIWNKIYNKTDKFFQKTETSCQKKTSLKPLWVIFF